MQVSNADNTQGIHVLLLCVQHDDDRSPWALRSIKCQQHIYQDKNFYACHVDL
jgi:hypothetical protein